MTLSIAHIVNPFSAKPGSELAVAQPITLETMRLARDYAAKDVNVELYSAQFAGDRPVVPEYFTPTPDLTRSVLDTGSFDIPRKLPLIKDILDRLFGATDAEYCIYTNVDISLMPQFYSAIAAYVELGYDAFSITKRTIPVAAASHGKIPLMQAAVGSRHEGYDCFVFRRDVYPKYRLGDACIGIPGVGYLLLWNVLLHGRQCSIFNNTHLTFHVGEDDLQWATPRAEDYRQHNLREMRRFVEWLKAEHGPIGEDHRLWSVLAPIAKALGLVSKSRRYWRQDVRLALLRLLARMERVVRRI